MKKNIVFILLIIGAYLFGGMTYGGGPIKDVAQLVPNPASAYPLLAKRVLIEDPNEPIVAFASLRSQLSQYFTQNNLSGNLYFEYLPTGTSIRIGVEEKRVAASLIKLPFAMEAYYAKERGLLDFNKKIVVTEDMLNSDYGSLYKKGAGYEITLEEAIELMLKDSDNTALNIVTSQTNGVVPAVEGVFNFLDAEFVQNEDFTVSLTPRAYSSFLKCLYFSCYLSKEGSQELLTTLSESRLTSRLPAKLPQGVLLAHKVGNFYDQTQSDCGIFYVPKRNYILCVMLDGPDSQVTDEYIATVSKMAYDYVTSK